MSGPYCPVVSMESVRVTGGGEILLPLIQSRRAFGKLEDPFSFLEALGLFKEISVPYLLDQLWRLVLFWCLCMAVTTGL